MRAFKEWICVASVILGTHVSLAQSTVPIDLSGATERTDQASLDVGRLQHDVSAGTFTFSLDISNESSVTFSTGLYAVLDGLNDAVVATSAAGQSVAGNDPVLVLEPSAEQLAAGRIGPGEGLPRITVELVNPGLVEMDFEIKIFEMPPAEQEVFLPIVVDRPDGPLGASFSFSIDQDILPNATFEWTVGGASATGRSVSLEPGTPGVVVASVVARDVSGGVLGRGRTTVTVFDGAGYDIVGNQLPGVPGDLDGDGSLTLADQLRLRQALSGLAPLTDPDAFERADFDFNGNVDGVDAELATLSLLGGANGSGVSVPQAAAPGGEVTVYSHALADPAARITVNIGGRPSELPVQRSVLGRLAVFIPLDVLTPGQLTTTGGQTDIAILIDGVVADVIPVTIVEPHPIDPLDPLGDMRNAMQEVALLRELIIAELQDPMADATFMTLGYEQGVAQAIGQAIRAMHEQLVVTEQGMLEALEGLSQQDREAAARIYNANGLQEVIADLNESVSAMLQAAPMSATTPPPGTLNADSLLLLCRLRQALDVADIFGTVSEAGCAISSVACVGFLAFTGDLIIGDVVACAATISFCSSLYAVNSAVSLLGSLVPRLGDDLLVQAREIPDTSPQQFAFTPRVVVEQPICSALLSAGSAGNYTTLLIRKITDRVLRRGAIGQIRETAEELNAGILRWITEEVEKAVASVIAGPLDDLIGGVVNDVCQVVGIGGSTVAVDPNLIGTVAPTGSFTIEGGEIIYTCQDGATGNASLVFRLFTCLGNLTATRTVECGQTVSATITIGDNGSANDDIFEAAIDGTTVLTMNAPSRGVSANIQLAPGTRTLVMRGLAAPDGIGTYFVRIEASGQTLLSRSGSNLTAGTTLTFTFNVP